MDSNSKLVKWLKWLKSIEEEIYQLVVYKDIFWSTQKLIKQNESIQKPSIFYRFIGDTYISYALIGIRRQIKIDRDSISFARLLDELTKNPEILSREYFRELYKGSLLEELGQADKDFNQYCGDTTNHISKSMVADDLEELINHANKCEEFADKRIAHRDKRDPKSPLTFADLNNCIDFMDQLYCKYNLIFHALDSGGSLTPSYDYDWQAIFDEPWRIKKKTIQSNKRYSL
ncbi:MAG: hypothetical protein D3914_07450 [Candidatus Electrothrix sp. LOE2]|nr:hypothetical protein [Candidatus Electrothrix sp. LOE2]